MNRSGAVIDGRDIKPDADTIEPRLYNLDLEIGGQTNAAAVKARSGAKADPTGKRK